jgi:ketosteroid isomerase-like protein
MTPVQTIESAYDAFQRGDIPAILNLVAPGAKWRQSTMLPWGGNYTGPDGVAVFFNKLAAEMETTAFEARENVGVGQEVFSFGYYAGKSLKTGRTAGADWMFRWRVENGKIASFESYIDTAALLAAMTTQASAA